MAQSLQDRSPAAGEQPAGRSASVPAIVASRGIEDSLRSSSTDHAVVRGAQQPGDVRGPPAGGRAEDRIDDGPVLQATSATSQTCRYPGGGVLPSRPGEPIPLVSSTSSGVIDRAYQPSRPLRPLVRGAATLPTV